jgi:DNA-binding LacI/PurR family transcriptional regulator
MSLQAGETVGKYLLSKGHRHVAYISPFTNTWSTCRYDGVRASFQTAGLDNGVERFIIEGYSDFWKYEPKAKTRFPTEQLQNTFRALAGNSPPVFVHQLNKYMLKLLFTGITSSEIYYQLAQLCDEALRDSTITAWVAANDQTAIFLLDYLNQNNIPVPGKLSLVSFDDTRGAVEHNLTSYNFNIGALVNAMLMNITNRRSFPLSRKKRQIEVEGSIIERETSSAATV